MTSIVQIKEGGYCEHNCSHFGEHVIVVNESFEYMLCDKHLKELANTIRDYLEFLEE